MCGRYVLLRPDIRALLKRLHLEDLVPALLEESQYNIGPTQTVLAVLAKEQGTFRAGPVIWGMNVPLSTHVGRNQLVINARSETISRYPVFREAMAHRRCLLPASGFYEWRRGAGASEPWLFRLNEDEPFYLAGVWSSLGEGDEKRCVVLTTKANTCLQGIHDRMPVILAGEAAGDWLGEGGAEPAARRRLLEPFNASRMKAGRVNPQVGNIRNQGPACLEPWSGPPSSEQTELPL